MPTRVRIVPALVAYIACFAFGAAFPAQAEEEGPIIQDWQKKGLLAALNDPSAAVFKSIILSSNNEQIAPILRALAKTPTNPASRISELLKDEELYVRGAAVEALVTLGAKDQVPAIAEWKDQVPAIAEWKDQVPAIAKRLKDEDFYVRSAAVEALGKLGAKWAPPATARICILEPLAREQIDAFLVSRKTTLPADARVTGAEYERACRAYLAQALDDNQPCEGLVATQRVLSNPMDLMVVAWMIARDKQPDLIRLQEQQYESMADDYRRVNVGHGFPLARFAEQVYRMRLNDAEAIPEQDFKEELLRMERHKMVVRRELVDRSKQATTEWHFRHDKIMEFFIVQTFLGNGNERPVQHLGDTRFRGVYFLLAMLMPCPTPNRCGNDSSIMPPTTRTIP